MWNRKQENCRIGGGLPYDIGNAGDLLKHGVLAEFIRWRCESRDAGNPFRFLDPFGGMPWRKCKPPIVERMGELGECALSSAQTKITGIRRYYGSGHLACRVARASGAKIAVHASDGDSASRERLVRSGLLPLDFPDFNPECAYSVLKSELPPDGEILILLDPFGDFVECGLYRRVIPKIAELPPHAAAMVFVLKKEERESEYENLRDKYLKGAWVMRCPPLMNACIPTVRGEKSRHVEFLVVAPRLLTSASAEELRKRLICFAQKLAFILRLPCQDAKRMMPQIIG